MDGDGALSHFASCRTRHVRAKLVRRVHRLCACLHRLQYANGRFLFQALLTFSPVSVALPQEPISMNIGNIDTTGKTERNPQPILPILFLNRNLFVDEI